MTGPGEGKLELTGSKITVSGREVNGTVYIHLKGYSLARVTHLDVEADEAAKLIGVRGGRFLSIHGVKKGLVIKVSQLDQIGVYHPLLNEVLGVDEKTRTWVGGKIGGIYIGFRKPQVLKLEEVAEKHFGMRPK